MTHTYGDPVADLALLKDDLNRAIHIALEAATQVVTLGHRLHNVVIDLEQVRKNADHFVLKLRGADP